VLAAGCGSPEVQQADPATAHMKVLGILYGQYMTAHGGAAPSDQDQFVSFIDAEPANWNKLAGSAEEFLTSASGGRRLTVLYGADAKTPPDGSLPWIAHDAEAQNGQRLVANARGYVQLVDDAEFAKLFPAP
jgi:hypothetical protein